MTDKARETILPIVVKGKAPKVIWAWRKERRKMIGINVEVAAEQSWSGEQNVLPQVMESMGAAKYHHDNTVTALLAERVALQAQLAEARNAALEEAQSAVAAVDPQKNLDPRDPSAEGNPFLKSWRAIESLKSEPAPRAVPVQEVQNGNSSMPDEIAAWSHFPGGVTGQWSANTYDAEDVVIYVPKDG